jgi:hypothetical protein
VKMTMTPRCSAIAVQTASGGLERGMGSIPEGRAPVVRPER